jgi:hypothetical protein
VRFQRDVRIARAFDSYRVKGIPLMVIIGSDGRIVSVHSGYGEGSIPD